MSTILDALKKVERQRESPSDRLRHEPEPSQARARRVSTVTIVVCGLLGFGAGAGIALWRNAEPGPEGPVAAVTRPPKVIVSPLDTAALNVGAGAVGAGVAAPAESDSGTNTRPLDLPAGRLAAGTETALEPSPFAPAPAPPGPAAVGAIDSRGPAPGASSIDTVSGPGAASEPEIVAALRRPDTVPAPDAAGGLDRAIAPEQPSVEAGAESGEVDEDLEDAPPSEEIIVDTGRSPVGAPQITLRFLQWSADPARRFAFLSVDGGPSQRVREGDAAGAANVDVIMPDGIRLRHEGTLFVIRPRH